MDNSPTPNVPQDIRPTANPPLSQKSRHGCLTTWLILIIIANITNMIISSVTISANPGDYYQWALPAQIVLGIWAVICALALFRWKKWGFYGFLSAAVVLLILNLISQNYLYSFTPFISVIILYAVLNIGKDNKGWPQME